MKVIWKYNLHLNEGEQYIEMPSGAKGLSVAMQHERLTLWAEVDYDNPIELSVFRMVATGEAFSADCPISFIGTAFDGPFVWHVYQLHKEVK